MQRDADGSRSSLTSTLLFGIGLERKNVDADALSRLTTLSEKKYTRVHCGAFIRFYRGHDTDGRSPAGARYTVVLCCSLSKFTNMCRDQYNISSPLPKEEIMRAQREDNDIQFIIHHLQSGVKPSSKQLKSVGSAARGMMRGVE